MALIVFKVVNSVRWRAGTTIIHPSSGESNYIPPTNLSNYYTKTELNVDGGASIHFGNIIEAYHNNLLNIQGGLDTSSGDSSGYDAEYYHLDASTYYDIIGIDFQMSIIKDSANIVTLENDEASPGNNKLYGTNSEGVRGWYNQPEADSSGGVTYNFQYSLEEDSYGYVNLVGDTLTPGNNKYYGTDGSGVRGWYDLPSFDQMDSSAISEFYVFSMSLSEDSVGVVTLLNDEDSPGNSMYYGTNISGVKGWYILPTYETGSSGEWGVYTFSMSLNEDSVNVITLVNDEDAPGNEKYYGTNITGVKGWFDLPTAGGTLDSSGLAYVSAYGTPVNNQIAIFIDEDTVEGNVNFTFDGSTFYMIGDIQTDAIATNTKLGIGSFSNNVSGVYQVAIGYQCLYSYTDDSSEFPDAGGNVAIGYQCLYTADNEALINTAIGYQCLHSNTIGQDNVAIGYQALFSNTSAYFNIGIGDHTLYTNTTGEFNVGIGMEALGANISGNQNIGIGHQSLAANTTGNSNIALGYQCLLINTTGSYNFAYGWQTMVMNISGNYNLGIGYISLSSNTTGSSNIAIGHRALNENEIGHYNIGIGYEAGSFESFTGSLGLVTEGNYNIFIGYKTQALYYDDIKEVVIGHEAIGQGSNTTILGGIDNIATYLAGEIYCVAYDSDNVLNGSLPLADSSITQIVMYDPSTGKLYYGAGEGGSVSYAFAMSLDESAGTVTLDNDEESPGNSKYYGTDSGGIKGWFDLPEGSSGGGVDGSGANTRIAYWTDADTIAGDSDLYWDNNLNVTQAGASQSMLGPMFMGMYETVGGTIRCALIPGRGDEVGVDYAYLFDTTSSLGNYKLASFRIDGTEKAFINSVGLSAINLRATNFIWRYIIGDAALVSHDAEASTDEISYTKLKTITLGANINTNTTLRIKFDLKVETGSASPVYGKIYRNGVTIGTQREDTTGSYQTFSEDIDGWSAGDTLELWAYNFSGDADYSAYIRNFRICGSHNNTMLYEVTGTTS